MHVGHFAVGFLAKRFEPRISLGSAKIQRCFENRLKKQFLVTASNS
jgi:hypothetical protein